MPEAYAAYVEYPVPGLDHQGQNRDGRGAHMQGSDMAFAVPSLRTPVGGCS